MENKNGLAELLSEILDSQIENGRQARIPDERLLQALTTGPGLTDDERRKLLLSPVIRMDYKRVKDSLIYD